MREILFRGKRVDNGEWVYGYYHAVTDNYTPTNRHYITKFKKLENGEIILVGMFGVDAETVGQYTGLTDKNGVKIFEGDIAEHSYLKNEEIMRTRHIVKCELGYFWFGSSGIGYYTTLVKGNSIEVFGNIHDNPELSRGD